MKSWTFTVKTLPRPVYEIVKEMKGEGLTHWQTVILGIFALDKQRRDPEKFREVLSWVKATYPDTP